jgi:hypothetical protein
VREFFSSFFVKSRRLSLGNLIQEGTFLLMFSIGTLIILLAFLILFHNNATATRGYRLRTLERERTQLMLEQEVVKMKIAQAQALETLQNDKKIHVMIPTTKEQYYIIEDSAVAEKME